MANVNNYTAVRAWYYMVMSCTLCGVEMNDAQHSRYSLFFILYNTRIGITVK